MNCVNHPDVAAAAYCRTCGKALCATCKRDVRGVIYCEDCLAAHVSGAVPAGAPPVGPGPTVVVAPDGGNPVLAALLGMIPGVGAMFNGQFLKALIHVVIFACAIWATDHVGDAFGILVAFWWFYMVFDAYKTARARQFGLPLPDPFGFERMWGGSVSAGAVPPSAVMPGTPAVAPPPAGEEFRNAPVGAIVLIVIGMLFLLDTMGLFHWHWFGRLWPVILIVLGVWVWIRRRPVTD